MNITFTKTVTQTFTEELNADKLTVYFTRKTDRDNHSFDINYNDVEIGYGHLNVRTNFAHVTLYQENQDLEDFLVDGIENRTIQIFS